MDTAAAAPASTAARSIATFNAAITGPQTPPQPRPVAELLPLDAINPSRFSKIQEHRRSRFNKDALQELSNSIKAIGVAQPIVVRPRHTVQLREAESTKRWYVQTLNIAGKWNDIGTGHDDRAGAEKQADALRAQYEIVAGERRYLATKLAGLTTIPAVIRELTDLQAIEIQVVENLQREGLDPLDEAEGYEELMRSQKYTADDIAKKVGKSRSYVYQRLKLTDLCPEARKAYYDGVLTASTAVYVARIPHPDLQKQCVDDIAEEQRYGERWGAREIEDYVQENFMLALKDAPFPTADAELLKRAGACSACPKRTGSNRDLFGEVKSADVCTDTKCYDSKRTAHSERLRAEALTRGQKVITGPEAKKLMPHGVHNIKDHVALDARCYEDKKQRTYREILGKDAGAPVLVQNHSDKTFVEAVPSATVAKLLREKGGAGSQESSTDARYRREQKAREAKARLEGQVRRKLLQEISDKASGRALDVEDLRLIAQGYVLEMWHDSRKKIAALCGWTPPKGESGDLEKLLNEKLLNAKIAEMPADKLGAFLIVLSLARELEVNAYTTPTKPARMLATCKRLKIDADKVRREIEGAAAEQPAQKKKKPATTTKPKAAAGAKPAKKKAAKK